MDSIEILTENGFCRREIEERGDAGAKHAGLGGGKVLFGRWNVDK